MFNKTSLKAIVKEVENLNKWREEVKTRVENGKDHRLGLISDLSAELDHLRNIKL
jgi:hypothetical protein